MGIHKSAEDYLESIYKLLQQQGQVRSIDVVEDLHFSKPSVSVAMKKLRESGHVLMDENGLLSLTPAGEAIGKRIYERHVVIAAMLTALGVEPHEAAEEACLIEHDLSDSTFDKIREHYQTYYLPKEED